MSVVNPHHRRFRVRPPFSLSWDPLWCTRVSPESSYWRRKSSEVDGGVGGDGEDESSPGVKRRCVRMPVCRPDWEEEAAGLYGAFKTRWKVGNSIFTQRKMQSFFNLEVSTVHLLHFDTVSATEHHFFTALTIKIHSTHPQRWFCFILFKPFTGLQDRM